MAFPPSVLLFYSGRLRQSPSEGGEAARIPRWAAAARGRLEKDNTKQRTVSRFIFVGCFP